MKAFSNSSYYTDQVLLEAAYYWERKDAGSVPMDAVKLKSIVEDYSIQQHLCFSYRYRQLCTLHPHRI